MGRPRIEMPTRDKLYIVVNTFGRWRISNPSSSSPACATSERPVRLEDIIGSEVRNAVAKHDLIELIRTDKDRKPVVDALVTADDPKAAVLLPITKAGPPSKPKW